MRRSERIVLYTAVVGIAAIVSLTGYFLIKPAPIILQGEVEATQIRVSSKIAGRIDSLHVKEGATVNKGDVLVSIESPELDAKLKQAEAAKKAAQAQKNKADSGTRIEQILSAKNMWQKAKAAEELAFKTFQRVKHLNQEGVLPSQKLDEADANYQAAQRSTEAAKASYDMAVKGARIEDKQAAQAMMDKAAGAVAEVEAYLRETRLAAPISGETASIIPKTGELITPGFPIITIVDLNDVWVTFNLKEDLLTKIKMGTILEARFPALGEEKVTLKVNYINALGQFATWHATKTRGDFDMKTFEIRATPVSDIEGLRPGMTALVAWDQIRNENNNTI